MNRFGPLTACVPFALAACAPGMGVYTSAEVVYAEPAEYVYVAPRDRVVVVTREVLVAHGYVVYREEEDGPALIIWARRGHHGNERDGENNNEGENEDEVVRVFVSRNGDRVAVRGLTEVREHGHREGWRRKDRAEGVVGDIDRRMRRRREGGEH